MQGDLPGGIAGQQLGKGKTAIEVPAKRKRHGEYAQTLGTLAPWDLGMVNDYNYCTYCKIYELLDSIKMTSDSGYCGGIETPQS